MNPNDAHDTRRNKHVFVINGSIDVLTLVRELLQEDEFNVTTTNFVPNTWDQIEALQPNLLMIDLVVGERAGWNLLERLHQQASTMNIPVIIFSTDSELLETAKVQREAFGGRRFILKPFDVDVLLEAVHELIGRASQR